LLKRSDRSSRGPARTRAWARSGAWAVPKTVFDLVTAALDLRRLRRIAPFTIQSCDNIRGNGEIARAVFTAFARAKDETLAKWIDENVTARHQAMCCFGYLNGYRYAHESASDPESAAPSSAEMSHRTSGS
jgi:mannitol-1-phosphate/altronate dehydrogenase